MFWNLKISFLVIMFRELRDFGISAFEKLPISPTLNQFASNIKKFLMTMLSKIMTNVFEPKSIFSSDYVSRIYEILASLMFGKLSISPTLNQVTFNL